MNDFCSFDGCARPTHASNLCEGHYEQRRRGETLRPMRPRRSDPVPSADWFWKQTKPNGDCREWKLAINSDGYGSVSVLGRTVKAHRYAYMLSGAELPDSAAIDHICRNKRCVEPRHLRIATKKQNAENVGLRSDNSSGVRGVSWVKSRGRWVVTVGHNGKHINGGYFEDLDSAGRRARELRAALYTHAEEHGA